MNDISTINIPVHDNNTINNFLYKNNDDNLLRYL